MIAGKCIIIENALRCVAGYLSGDTPTLDLVTTSINFTSWVNDGKLYFHMNVSIIETSTWKYNSSSLTWIMKFIDTMILAVNISYIIYVFYTLIILPTHRSSAATALLTNYHPNTKTYLLTHWGWDKMDAISQTTFSNAFSWMKMY